MNPDKAYGYAVSETSIKQQYAASLGPASAPTPLSPVIRLVNAVERAEETALMVHRVRVAMIGDVPEGDAAGNKEYHGEGLIGRIAEAASRIERASARIMRDLEDMHRATGDF